MYNTPQIIINDDKTISATFSSRDFEILTAFIGGTNANQKMEWGNKDGIVRHNIIKPIEGYEAFFFGRDVYNEMKEAVKKLNNSVDNR